MASDLTASASTNKRCTHLAGEALPTDIEAALAALVSQQRSMHSTSLTAPSADGPRHGCDGEDHAVLPAAAGSVAPDNAAADMRLPDVAPAQPSSNNGAIPAGGLRPHAPESGSSPTVSATAAAALLEAAVALPERGDVLVTDMLDHRCSIVATAREPT